MYLHLTGPVVKVGTADQNLPVNLVKHRQLMRLLRSSKQFKTRNSNLKPEIKGPDCYRTTILNNELTAPHQLIMFLSDQQVLTNVSC